MHILDPIIGAWYKDRDTNTLFEVVAWDPSAETIEAQHLDGEITEYDLETWQQMALQKAEAPEDWRTSYELPREDALDPDTPLHPEQWNSPLTTIEPDSLYGAEDY
ncbi:hypothetical protein CWI75_10525 [Kineobactrum sediminis]|uniref:Uncharacterized protein n=2 Tax=Kineobactrum sediminis TaxID=1905677 RepID=A0A2N5Y2C2_9GAMM|nr:hypothetical protein CWI75_10525 [Kineobactrum sediminis]